MKGHFMGVGDVAKCKCFLFCSAKKIQYYRDS